MKIITVAAGEGMRLSTASPEVPRPQSLGRIPKALFPINSEPLVKISTSIYSEWIKDGLVQYSDLFYVVQQAHDDEFQITSLIRQNIHEDVHTVIIPMLSKGPADTALSAIAEIDENEAILINDCDHYYSSIGLLKVLSGYTNNNYDFDVLITTTKPRNTIPSWSYAVVENDDNPLLRRVTDIREKDPELARKGAPGVIGSYFFKSAKLFKQLYEDAFGDHRGEKYVSNVIQHAIRENFVVKSTQSNFGYPLGNIEEINTFKTELKQKNLDQTNHTIFIDFSAIFQFPNDFNNLNQQDFSIDALNYSVQETQLHEIRNTYGTGNTVIIFSTNTHLDDTIAKNLLKTYKVPYDHFISGLSDGHISLITKITTTPSYIDKASQAAMNLNTDISQLSKPRHQGKEIIHDLTSGSGAKTFRLLDEFGKSFIRKCISLQPSIENEKIASVLSLQANWLTVASKSVPHNVPQLINIGQTQRFFCLDIQDIGDVPTLQGFIRNIDISETEKIVVIDKMLALLNDFYKYNANAKYPHSDDIIIDLILKKAIPAVNLIFGSSGLSAHKLGAKKELFINGIARTNPLTQLSKIISRIEDGSLKLGGLKCDYLSYIHGDLTAENILIDENQTPIFIDPLGPTMDITAIENGLIIREKSSPFFDYIKLMQSFKTNYEMWNIYEMPTEIDDQSGLWYKAELVASQEQYIDKIKLYFDSIGTDTSDANTNLMLAILLLRIIPYKIQNQFSQALMCLCIATELMENV